jgi:hypothetical protein
VTTTTDHLGIATTIARQIGAGNIMAISGGRIRPIPNGLELPVAHGYRVRVVLTGADDYTVTRIFTRSGREFTHGQATRVCCDQVGDMAYYASCFRSYDATEWPNQA